jgi:hypothetical protein
VHKCWEGYKITKSEGDTKNVEYYANAKGIRKFQRELKTSVSEFLQFGLLGRKTPEELYLENTSQIVVVVHKSRRN